VFGQACSSPDGVWSFWWLNKKINGSTEAEDAVSKNSFEASLETDFGIQMCTIFFLPLIDFTRKGIIV